MEMNHKESRRRITTRSLTLMKKGNKTQTKTLILDPVKTFGKILNPK
jgi:hypothetical protein